MHGFACVFLPHFLQTAPFPARSERVSATALKPPRKAGGRGGESTARGSDKCFFFSPKQVKYFRIIFKQPN
ncbi:hypothetical protein [Escherichia coli]|uniref:hypothetical protein n=1 Tax=Escherichia coli TaxID=562 RepID=UPI0010CC6055|nr:hypothetical protein [Escherichia coli]